MVEKDKTATKTTIAVYITDVDALNQLKVHPNQSIAEIFHRYVTSFPLNCNGGTVCP